MRRYFLGATLLALSLSVALAQPVLRSDNPVVNGASYGTSIAPGSIFVVFGTTLAGAAVQTVQALPLTTTMGGVSIRFTPTGGGTGIDAYMIYTTQNQIAGLLPSTTAAGKYNVTVTYNNQTSAPGAATVAAKAYGIVTADSSGVGMAQGQIYNSATSWDLTRFAVGRYGPYTTAPAHPGAVIALWGTGMGADANSDASGGVNADFKSATTITVGSKNVAVAYAGRSSGLPGTDQLNFVLPGDVDTGCNVPVTVKVGDSVSNVVTLAIAASGQTVCQDSYLSSDTLLKLSQGQTVVTGFFTMIHQTTSLTVPILGSIDSTNESVSGAFAKLTFTSLVQSVGSGLLSPNGTCQTFRRTGTQDSLLSSVPTGVLLDAGSQLVLNGPNVVNVAVPRGTTDNAYFKTLSTGGLLGGGTPLIAQGTYTLAGTGGADITPFTASLSVPALLNWTNKSSISNVNRGQSLAINWSGGGSSDTVLISGFAGSQTGGTQTSPIYTVGGFVCLAQASAGTFSVPASVLSQVPATSGDITSGSIGFLAVTTNGNGTNGKFTASTVADGKPIDNGLFTYAIGSSKTVAYQ